MSSEVAGSRAREMRLMLVGIKIPIFLLVRAVDRAVLETLHQIMIESLHVAVRLGVSW